MCPIYEFLCENCDEVIESLVKLNTREIKCKFCGGVASKIISLSSFQLKGGGWEADGYSSNKGSKDCNKSKGG